MNLASTSQRDCSPQPRLRARATLVNVLSNHNPNGVVAAHHLNDATFQGCFHLRHLQCSARRATLALAGIPLGFSLPADSQGVAQKNRTSRAHGARVEEPHGRGSITRSSRARMTSRSALYQAVTMRRSTGTSRPHGRDANQKSRRARYTVCWLVDASASGGTGVNQSKRNLQRTGRGARLRAVRYDRAACSLTERPKIVRPSKGRQHVLRITHRNSTHERTIVAKSHRRLNHSPALSRAR